MKGESVATYLEHVPEKHNGGRGAPVSVERRAGRKSAAGVVDVEVDVSGKDVAGDNTAIVQLLLLGGLLFDRGGLALADVELLRGDHRMICF